MHVHINLYLKEQKNCIIKVCSKQYIKSTNVSCLEKHFIGDVLKPAKYGRLSNTWK